MGRMWFHNTVLAATALETAAGAGAQRCAGKKEERAAPEPPDGRRLGYPCLPGRLPAAGPGGGEEITRALTWPGWNGNRAIRLLPPGLVPRRVVDLETGVKFVSVEVSMKGGQINSHPTWSWDGLYFLFLRACPVLLRIVREFRLYLLSIAIRCLFLLPTGNLAKQYWSGS